MCRNLAELIFNTQETPLTANIKCMSAIDFTFPQLIPYMNDFFLNRILID